MAELRIEMTSGSPTREQAAAVAAALERFLADTAPPPAAAGPQLSGWQRTALLEGTTAGGLAGNPWGEPRGWGALRT